MNESDVIKIIERVIENIFNEIWEPLNLKITEQFNALEKVKKQVIKDSKNLNKLVKLYNTRIEESYAKLGESVNEVNAFAKKRNISKKVLKEELIKVVDDKVNDLIDYGNKIQVLYEDLVNRTKYYKSNLKDDEEKISSSLIRVYDSKLATFNAHAIAYIQQISDAQKRFIKLTGIANEQLKKHQLYEFIDDPMGIEVKE